MSFIIKVSLVLLALLLIVSVHYHNFTYKKRFKEYKNIASISYVKPAFVFKSKEYKRFVYVK